MRSKIKNRILSVSQEMTTILVIILTIISCKDSSPKEIDFCRMLELDQSYTDSDSINKEKFNLNKKKRHKLIKDNFNQLIQYSKQSGFPEMGSLQTTGLDSCRNWAVMITLFHIGQIQPKLFFENGTKQLFEKEISEGRLKSGSLFPPLREGFRSHDFCIDNKESILAALESWQLNLDDLPDIKFVNCKK